MQTLTNNSFTRFAGNAIAAIAGRKSYRYGSIEDPNVPLDEAFEESWFGGRTKTSSGVRVTPQSALKVAALWQGASMISGDVAKIPIEIYARAGKKRTDRRLLNKHPVYRLLRRRPNRKQSASEFRRQLMLHALIWGNAYAFIRRNNQGTPVELLPLLPDRTTSKDLPDGRTIYQSEIDGRLEYFDSHDIFHIKGISFNGRDGLETFAYARDAIGKILARENFASRFFKNGGRIGGVLQLRWANNKKQKDKRESNFRRNYENADAAFRTVVLRDDAKFHAAQASFHDTQLVDVERADVRTVARILNMPPHKLGAEGNSSYNSLEQENQAYYDNCLSHWLIAFESECYLKLFTLEEQEKDEFYFEHTIGALLWADSKTVASIGGEAVAKGWMTPNEVRAWFNLNDHPDGDRLYIPSGAVPADQAGDDEEEEDDPPDDSPADDPDSDPDPDPTEEDESETDE